MPTNEDRKAVSAKLRDMAKERVWHDSYFIAYLIGALSMESRASVGEILERLADLIEPEPERTCHDIHEPPTNGGFWPSPHFKCSKCKLIHVSMDYVYYCPNCGTRVKEDADA